MSSANPSNVAPRSSLSAAEAAQLASGLAELAKANMPLPAGLRALAEEWPSRRLRPALLDLANRLEQGVSLEDAINTVGSRLPAHLRGLIIAGIRSNRLPEALDQYVDMERTQHDLYRQIWINMAYPTVLLAIMSFLALLADFYIKPQFEKIFKDFGTSLPGITQFILTDWGPFTFILLAITALTVLIPLILALWPISSLLSPLIYLAPVIGPLLRWSQMARFSRLMAMLLGQNIPLPESLRLTSKSVHNVYIARACRKAAANIEQGRYLSDSLTASRQFSPDLLPLIEVGERTSSLGEAFQSAADMFEGRASTQGKNLEVFLLPATFLAIICLCGIFIIGLFMPFMCLITHLTGGGYDKYYDQASKSPEYSNLFVFYIVSTLLAVTVLLFLLLTSVRKKHAGNRLLYSIIFYTCYVVIICGIIGGLISAPEEAYSIGFWIVVICLVGYAVGYFIFGILMWPRLRVQQNALLWTLAISVEKKIPLVPTITAFAEGHSMPIASKARKLAKLLDSGVPLPDALEHVPDVLPARTLPIIRAGYHSGALAKSLRQAVSSRDLLTNVGNSLSARLLYIVLVTSFAISVISFLMLKIIPSYEKIFKDFGTNLPALTTTLIGVSHLAVEAWYLFIPLYLLLIWLLFLLVSFNLGWSVHYFPGMARLLRRRHAAAILDSLAFAAEGQQPLDNSILSLAATYPQPAIRRKLCYVGVDVHSGADWCESLFRHGLIKQTDEAVLKAAQRVGNLPWAMRELADGNRRRLAYKLNALVQLAYPSIILCLGAIVLFIVTSLFMPLIVLITRLAGQ
jgi:type II secretory pathway component PulF